VRNQKNNVCSWDTQTNSMQHGLTGPTALELFVAEFPKLGLSIVINITETKRVALNLSKSIEIQLSHEATKVVVLEELSNNVRGKLFCVLYDKGQTISRPATSKGFEGRHNEWS
jgi:hypothetical protein